MQAFNLGWQSALLESPAVGRESAEIRTDTRNCGRGHPDMRVF